jgi:uncharacterized membrane protein
VAYSVHNPISGLAARAPPTNTDPSIRVSDIVMIRILALLPFIGVLVGACFFNRVTPLVFGLPVLLAWLLLWLLLTSAIMALIYCVDPANRPSATDDGRQS